MDNARETEDRAFNRQIKEIHAVNRGVYGTPRIKVSLKTDLDHNQCLPTTSF